MKNISLKFLSLIGIAFLLMSCRGEDGLPGPEGPQGPEGPEGPPGVGLMYEFDFSLNGSNDWERLYTFPANDEIYTDDVVVVYLLWKVVNGVDVWRPLPVTYFYSDGPLQINYDFTVNDVRIFAEAAFTLDPNVDKYNNLVARAVIVPAKYSPNQRKELVDLNDYEAVKKAYNIKEPARRLKGTPFEEILSDLKKK